MRNCVLFTCGVLACVAAAGSAIAAPPAPHEVTVPAPAALFKEVKALMAYGKLLPGSHLYMYGARMADYYTIDRANALAIASTAAHGVAGVKRFPDGSLLIKENFDQHKRLQTITAMLKLPGYDAQDRNWVMAAYKPDGSPLFYGKVASCINCHAIARNTDFVFPPLEHLSVGIVQAFFPGQPLSPRYLRIVKARTSSAKH